MAHYTVKKYEVTIADISAKSTSVENPITNYLLGFKVVKYHISMRIKYSD